MTTPGTGILHLDGDQIVCECHNDDFEPCDTRGFAQEPLADSDWHLTYRCTSCGVIAKAADDWQTVIKIGVAPDEAFGA